MDGQRRYQVTVENDGRWVFVRVPALGCMGEADGTHDIEGTARDMISMWLNVRPETVAVEIEQASTWS